MLYNFRISFENLVNRRKNEEEISLMLHFDQWKREKQQNAVRKKMVIPNLSSQIERKQSAVFIFLEYCNLIIQLLFLGFVNVLFILLKALKNLCSAEPFPHVANALNEIP